MPTRQPFIDTETGALDRDQLLVEAIPLAKLLLFFVVGAAIAFAPAVIFGNSIIAAVLALVGQFVLAVGAGIVIIYAVVRGIDLAGVPRRRDLRGQPDASPSDRHNFDRNQEETERPESERGDADEEAAGSER